MGLFGSSPRDGADRTLVALVAPDGGVRFRDPPAWLSTAPYLELDRHGDSLLLLEPTGRRAGSDRELERVEDGVECELGAVLGEYGIDPGSLPDPVAVRVAYDDDQTRVVLDVDALLDGLVAGVDAGDDVVVSACPWC